MGTKLFPSPSIFLKVHLDWKALESELKCSACPVTLTPHETREALFSAAPGRNGTWSAVLALSLSWSAGSDSVEQSRSLG